MIPLKTIGHATPRIDAIERVTGKAAYTNDVRLPGMLYGRILRSPHPHARIRRIDLSKAMTLPGAMGVIGARSVVDPGYFFCAVEFDSEDALSDFAGSATRRDWSRLGAATFGLRAARSRRWRRMTSWRSASRTCRRTAGSLRG